MENFVRSAKLGIMSVTSRLAAPQIGRALIVFFYDAFSVARVDRYRDKIEKRLISRLGTSKCESFI